MIVTHSHVLLSIFLYDFKYRFNISTKDCSIIFGKVIPLLAVALQPMIICHPREVISKSIPKAFGHYKGLRMIIDCSEIMIEKPLDLKLQAATWSDYKHRNTLKFLIGIAPQGTVMYVSKLWGGRASDRYNCRTL